MRAKKRDLEPAEREEILPAKAYEEIVQLQHEFGNQAVAHWITQRAQFRRLTPAEQRERTEGRPEEIAQVLERSESRPAEAAEEIARIFGLSDREIRLAGEYGKQVSRLGLVETIERLDCTADLDDRTRTAIQLVLRAMKRKV